LEKKKLVHEIDTKSTKITKKITIENEREKWMKWINGKHKMHKFNRLNWHKILNG